MERSIRLATAEDCRDILDIYSYYIRCTPVSFETEVPTLPDFTRRIERIIADYPYLVYAIDGEPAGYAYASRHAERAAYRYGVDVSIYVSRSYHGSGIAYKLYSCLFDILRELGYCNVYAIITVPNARSENFHKKIGFSAIGICHKTGYKAGAWHDVLWMEKHLRKHVASPAPLKTMDQLTDEFLRRTFFADRYQ